MGVAARRYIRLRARCLNDEALLVEVISLPLPLPAFATTGAPGASGTGKAVPGESASAQEGVTDGGEDGPTLVSALEALAQQCSDISIPITIPSGKKEEEAVQASYISRGQQAVIVLIVGAQRKSLSIGGWRTR